MDNHPTIQHLWFDFDGTITFQTPEFHAAHDELRHRTYANATGKPLTEKLKEEFHGLYKKYGSNSAVFRSLGLPTNYWQEHFNTLDVSKLYKPNPSINMTLDYLRTKLPISLFTNLTGDKIPKMLSLIAIEQSWFTHVLSGDDIKERKPALDGFYKMIELSQLPAKDLMYVGDRVDVDLKPAKAVGIQTCLMWGKSEETDFSCEKFEDLIEIVLPGSSTLSK
ncbi:MAG: HAD family hydrolase [Patescibacteria group bacterium]